MPAAHENGHALVVGATTRAGIRVAGGIGRVAVLVGYARRLAALRLSAAYHSVRASRDPGNTDVLDFVTDLILAFSAILIRFAVLVRVRDALLKLVTSADRWPAGILAAHPLACGPVRTVVVAGTNFAAVFAVVRMVQNAPVRRRSALHAGRAGVAKTQAVAAATSGNLAVLAGFAVIVAGATWNVAHAKTGEGVAVEAVSTRIVRSAHAAPKLPVTNEPVIALSVVMASDPATILAVILVVVVAAARDRAKD